jgi:MSHA biogenesis protein MshM
MYLQHFGLAQYPFSLTPNTHFFLKLRSHVETFDQLIAALDANAGFVKIIGEVGTGKTMLCRKVLNALEHYKSRYITAYIPHPVLSADGIMHALAEEFSVEHSPATSYFELLKIIIEQLLNYASENKQVVLFIDEAQAMPEETLEAIRLLTNTNRENRKLLQVVLFGQPELNSHLQSHNLKLLKEQIQYTFDLPALDRDNLGAYVSHRLLKAGYSGPAMFTREAVDQLFKASRGIPRLVNILAHKSLMAAYGQGKHSIDPRHVKRAIADTESAASDVDSVLKRLLVS